MAFIRVRLNEPAISVFTNFDYNTKAFSYISATKQLLSPTIIHHYTTSDITYIYSQANQVYLDKNKAVVVANVSTIIRVLIMIFPVLHSFPNTAQHVRVSFCGLWTNNSFC